MRYDEVLGADEIRHAFRVTVRATNGYVWPASHRAGSNSQALPMGARLRLKASKDLSGFHPELQKIFRAMQRYGLIVADNGSDMYISGAFDPRWNNDMLNPAFRSLNASDFEVIQLGWRGGVGAVVQPARRRLRRSVLAERRVRRAGVGRRRGRRRLRDRSRLRRPGCRTFSSSASEPTTSSARSHRPAATTRASARRTRAARAGVERDRGDDLSSSSARQNRQFKDRVRTASA